MQALSNRSRNFMDMYASCATNSGGWWIGFLLSWGLNREETMFPMQALFY